MKMLKIAVTTCTLYIPHALAVQMAYDGQAAAAYARQYAEFPNIAFNNYVSHGSDCTNFVSQALQAGGWKPDSNWFYKPDHKGPLGLGISEQSSKSWRLVVAWADFAKANPQRVQRVSSVQQLSYGDVIQVDWHNDGRLDHTIIVSGINASGERLVAGHSPAHTNTPFSIFQAINKNDPKNKGFEQRYVYYHIVGVQ